MKMLINTNEGKYVENLKKMARQGSLTKDLNPAVCFMTNPKSVLFIFYCKFSVFCRNHI